MTPAGPALPPVLVQLDTLDELELFLGSSETTPVVLYKHSLTCGSSAYAFEEISALVPMTTVPIGMVRVQTARTVSNTIAERFGIRHQSPQVLIVRNGEVVWHTSHSGVTAERIHEALQVSRPV